MAQVGVASKYFDIWRGGENNTYAYVGDTYLAKVTGGGNSYTLGYDALGRCVKRTLGTTTTYYVYDGEKPILEYDSAGAMDGNNVYGRGIDEIVMRGDYVIVPSGQGYFPQQDHEGSVTHLTSFQGAVIEKYRYDAFGAATTTYSQGTFNNRFLFTGREYAPRFGIYEYRARAYHPGLGRFMSEDPKGFDAGDYNLYRYCANDPLDKTDPMGLGVDTDPLPLSLPILRLGIDAALRSYEIGRSNNDSMGFGLERGKSGFQRIGGSRELKLSAETSAGEFRILALKRLKCHWLPQAIRQWSLVTPTPTAPIFLLMIKRKRTKREFHP